VFKESTHARIVEISGNYSRNDCQLFAAVNALI